MDVTGTGYEDICNLDSTKIFNSLKDKARTAKAANHKLPGKLSSNVSYVSWSLGVDAIGDDDDLSHVYLPNFKQL